MMKYYLEFKENTKTEYVWLVEINEEPHYRKDYEKYTTNENVDKISIKFLENLKERNVFRREVLFEKTRVVRNLKTDSEFIITLVRVHLFMGNRHGLLKGLGPFSNPTFRLHKILDDGNVITTWILNDVTIVESSFYLNPAVTSIEKETITILPNSYWSF